jgi:hypothetical protein
MFLLLGISSLCQLLDISVARPFLPLANLVT